MDNECVGKSGGGSEVPTPWLHTMRVSSAKSSRSCTSCIQIRLPKVNAGGQQRKGGKRFSHASGYRICWLIACQNKQHLHVTKHHFVTQCPLLHSAIAILKCSHDCEGLCRAHLRFGSGAVQLVQQISTAGATQVPEPALWP